MTKCQQVARQCACFNLRKATRAVTQLYDEVLRETGIRVTQLTLLVAAYLSGEIPISQMAEVLVMDRTTLTRNLKPLQIQGLIAIRSGADRREKLVTLTTRGRAMVSKALAAVGAGARSDHRGTWAGSLRLNAEGPVEGGVVSPCITRLTTADLASEVLRHLGVKPHRTLKSSLLKRCGLFLITYV